MPIRGGGGLGELGGYNLDLHLIERQVRVGHRSPAGCHRSAAAACRAAAAAAATACRTATTAACAGGGRQVSSCRLGL